MEVPELNWRLTQSRLEEVRFREELLLSGPKFIANRLVAEQKRIASQVQIAGLMAQRERLLIRAPVSGTVTLVKEGLTPGLWVGKEDELLEIRQFGSERVIAYVVEKDRYQVIPGSRGSFIPIMPVFQSWRCDGSIAIPLL